MKRIFIDPGHGGADPGAIANNLVEKELNLKVSLYLSDILLRNGLEVVMSRTEDVGLTIEERSLMANRSQANYCISIHHNSGGGSGVETIHSVYGGKGKEMADEILKVAKSEGRIIRTAFSKLSGSGNGDYYGIIRETDMPSVIYEGGFVDNLMDANILKTDIGLKKEASVIAKAIFHLMGVNEMSNGNDYENHWAVKDIHLVIQKGLFNETEVFRPDSPITRAEVAAVLARLIKKLNI